MKIYHDVNPQNFQVNNSGYRQHETIDFVLSFPNRKIILNTIRVNAEVEIENIASQIYLDNFTGAHSFFDSWSTTIGSQIVENITANYPRLVKMKMTASEAQERLATAKHSVELKAPVNYMTNDLLYGEVVPDQPLAQTAIPNNLMDFSIKPIIALNSANGSLRSATIGDITLSCTLNTNSNALYGPNMDGTVAFKLTNLTVSFMSDDDDGQDEQVSLVTYLSLNQTIASSYQNISLRVPAIVSGVSCSFELKSNQGNVNANNQALYHVPNVTSLQFLFNDSTNTFVPKEMKNQVEILSRYLESWDSDRDMNMVSMANVKANNAYGVGLNMGYIDLRNQKFNVQLQSSVSNIEPVEMYFFFKSFLQI